MDVVRKTVHKQCHSLFASVRVRPRPCPSTCRSIDDELLPHAFAVCTLSKEMMLAADSAEERRRWLEQLRCVGSIRGLFGVCRRSCLLGSRTNERRRAVHTRA